MPEPPPSPGVERAELKPRFKPHFQVRVLEPDLVYLLDEVRSFVLTGSLYCRLVPFMDGTHTIREIAGRLGVGDASQLAVEYAIARLVGRGFVTYGETGSGPDSAYWSLLGEKPERVPEALARARVSVLSVGEASGEPLSNILRGMGVTCAQASPESAETSSLWVVVTDDYLRPLLSEINRRALDRNQPWMLMKPHGVALWLGPLMIPGSTGCWGCLAHRLYGNKPIDAFLRMEMKDPAHCIPTSLGSLSTTRATAVHLAATEIVKNLVRDDLARLPEHRSWGTYIDEVKPLTLHDRLVTLDTVTLESRNHFTQRRPQCPVCGTPMDPGQDPEPVALESREKTFVSDGGHRSLTPEQTRRRWEHLLSPITGVVNEVYSLSDESDQPLHFFQSVVPFGIGNRYAKASDVLHRRCSGKGKSASQAWTSAFSEGVERYCSVFSGQWERYRKATLSDLGEAAVHPNEILLYSPAQYQDRKAWNESRPGDRYWTPRTFAPDRVIPWTPLWSLTNHNFRYVPTFLCYFGVPLSGDEPIAIPDSNGLAAGNNLEEAVLQGLMEVIERDAFGIWWYNRIPRPSVDLRSFGDPFLVELENTFEGRDREIWALDITSDLGVPTFVAFSRRMKGGPECICIGCGTHVDPQIALLRAVTEMVQITVPTDQIDWMGPSPHHDPVRVEWMRDVRMGDHPHLAPARDQAPRARADYSYDPQGDLLVDIRHLVETLGRKGLETLVLDLTKPDIGMSVVRVAVPGLRSYSRRLAPGRLYEVPVDMGWLSAATLESEMNPFPMFL